MNHPTTITILAAVAVGCGLRSTAQGQAPSTDVRGRVVDVDLESHDGHPIVVDGRNILLFDQPAGVPEVMPISRAIVLVVGDATYRERGMPDRDRFRGGRGVDPGRTSVVETLDGQRIPGTTFRDDDGRILWRSAWLPDLVLDPETLSAVRLVEGAEIVEAVDADVVLLANGDRIEGFVESIGDSVVLEMVGGDRDGESIEVPLDRVASISIVNPPTEPSGVMVWSRGGHRLLGESLEIGDDGYLRLRRPALGGDVAEIPSEDLLGASFAADRVRPWSSLEWIQEAGPATFLRPWIPPIERESGHHPIDAKPMRIHGSMKASAVPPWPTAAFRVVVERAPDAGPGSCVFVVRDGERELSRHPIDRENPVVVATGEVRNGPIVFEVEPGDDGPFEDELVLREAFLVRTER